MGEVWKARDARLGRDVALKVLPAEYAADAELRQRLELEAKTIARMEHPHICRLYDVGEDYLVMELLDGEALDDRLAGGPLPIEDVLRYGSQIALALDRAHRAGIVHRDLKPGNVMITKAGAKLLDFGLAKSVRLPIAGEDVTVRKPLTEEGMVVGTMQYMAPEQLEGRPVDHRTDIFALGAVLYEMTTGRPAFTGDSRASLIAAIMTTQPRPVSEMRRETPAELEHVIARCLAKDPEERWQSAGDIGEHLRWIGERRPQGDVPAARRAITRDLMWMAALLAAIVAGAWLAVKPEPDRDVIAAAIPIDGDSMLVHAWSRPAFSPDGKWLVYWSVDDRRRNKLWLRSMEHGATQQLPIGTDDAYAPFWSPDGKSIGFLTPPGVLKKYSMRTRTVETITPFSSAGACGSWNGEGVILCMRGWTNNAIWRVPASGGRPAEVLSAASIGALNVAYPAFLPDGRRFLFTAIGGAVEQRGQKGLWIATLDGSDKPRFLTRASSHGVYVEPETLLYAREGTLRARRFDPKSLVAGEDEEEVAPVWSFDEGSWPFAVFGASRDGIIVWRPPRRESLFASELLLRNRKGEIVRKIGETAYYVTPRVSPDGLRIAVDRSDEQGRGDIWTLSVSDGTASRVSFDAENETGPVWSPNGGELVWVNGFRLAGSKIVRKRAGEPERTVLQTPGFVAPTDWSPDGQHVAMEKATSENNFVAVWSLRDRKWTELPASLAYGGNFSPDGKWIVYQSQGNERYEIYVQPFPPTGAKYQVSPAGGDWPRWRRPGEITYVDLNGRINVVPVETAPAFRAGTPQPLFPIERYNYTTVIQYDVTPDGNFLVNQAVREPPEPLKLLVNWRRRAR